MSCDLACLESGKIKKEKQMLLPVLYLFNPLAHSTLAKIFSRQHTKKFFLIDFDISC